MKTKKPKDIASLIYENAILPLILQNGNNYGSDHRLGLREPNNPDAGRKRIIIEFGSPNTAKSFHAGHLRSTILGGFLANLYEEAGWDVTRMNYLGDWGKQYSVLGVGVEKFGDLDVLERDPIAQLFDVYVRVSAVGRKEQESIESMRKVIASRKSQGHPLEDMERELELLQANSMDERARKYFKRMCEGDEEALGLWKKFRDLSIIKYQASFARLNIHYDVYAGESQIKNESMKEVENMTKEKRVSEVSDGAVLVDLTKYSKKLSKAIVRKKDGTSNYMTRDIGAVFERDEEYHYDNMIYVIASQQDLHMAQLIKIIELIGREGLADKLEHVNFGLVHEMSTRRGTVKFLDDILRDAKDKMQEVMRSNQAKYEQVEDSEKIADILDISAVLVQDMASKRNDYTFDMDRMTSFEGDKGPYLQYSHARLCSIIRKADLPSEPLKDADLSLQQEKHAASIVQKLEQWPEVFQMTFKNKKPVTVLTYLWKLTHALNSMRSPALINRVCADNNIGCNSAGR
ncbi:Arginyl-tRNA synthetase [Aspergillus oryzae 100-8]|uniref:arginine--tRNA ligase n=1 Tax=Aspergillus oryzae (strain 3.042) TaxID=1160506 RepID=I8IRJ8_ASPO3|nr:Arginyl-tRNA synthetase [Aspergillus oryzae 3.042]KDE79692.1 Arginyl-tRNA synthetase [Aspergillus oryzae 100-8]|eukprot:EIT82006.1 Arginyl-tRNA synthetase [Aspergillus oryzae 3.042]